MKVEIQNDSSTATPLTDRLGAGPRTKHIDTRCFGYKNEFKTEILSINKVPTAKKCADVE